MIFLKVTDFVSGLSSLVFTHSILQSRPQVIRWSRGLEQAWRSSDFLFVSSLEFFFFFLYVLIGMNESSEDQIFQTNQWSPLVQFWLQSSKTVSWSPRALCHGVTFQIKVKSKWRWKGKVWGPSTASLVGNHPLSINTSNGRKSRPHFMKLHCCLTRSQSAPFPRTALRVLETVFSSPPRVSDSYLESRECEGTAILLDNISSLEQPRLAAGGFSLDAVMPCWG